MIQTELPLSIAPSARKLELTESELRRLWSKVEKRGPNECWPWKAYALRTGYGRIRFRGRLVLAHRLIFESSFRILAPSECACHRCDVPGCCNYRHMFAAI